MRIPTAADAYQVLLLQAADEGRGSVLFGESQKRARELVQPFMIGNHLPDIYFEHPLVGDPFLDVTVLYNDIEPGMRIDSPAAGEHAAMLDWFAGARRDYGRICCGFELDTKADQLPDAAVHFQPRANTELVRPFCEVIGEPERADLYLGLAERMPEGWPLSFFGVFRGRPGSPLRVCGYLDIDEKKACAHDPSHIAEAFDAVGFSAYDSGMLEQISSLMTTAPDTIDFQFDIYPDGCLGTTFAIDMMFGIEQPTEVQKTFQYGAGAQVMGLLESWGAADSRWKIAVQSAFARAIPVELDGGGLGRYAFTLMPKWTKARWTDATLQPSKLYHDACAKLVDDKL